MTQTDQIKDYFCPFCQHKLFRGHVKEFKMVCQECNKLVDSTKLPKRQEGENKDQAGDRPELAE